MARARNEQRFWNDSRLPFIEVREVLDGRRYCFDPHSHETFSIGSVLSGQCTYLNTHKMEHVGHGAVTIMNPGDVHACNPVDDGSWSYYMFYVDAGWLRQLQKQNGVAGSVDFASYGAMMSADPRLFGALNSLYDTLRAPQSDLLAKETAAVECFGAIDVILSQNSRSTTLDDARLRRVAEHIADRWSEQISLDDLCKASGLSASHLIRAFKKRYGLTPHAYLINRRLQVARGLIRKGRNVVDSALETSFFDQAHFHKAFKRVTSMTPGEYARAVGVRCLPTQESPR